MEISKETYKKRIKELFEDVSNKCFSERTALFNAVDDFNSVLDELKEKDPKVGIESGQMALLHLQRGARRYGDCISESEKEFEELYKKYNFAPYKR